MPATPRPLTADLRALASAGPPTPGAPEKAAVRSMFDRIAPRYDLLNRLLSAGVDVRWRRKAVDTLGLDVGQKGSARILDLCTGTADLLIEALGRDPRLRGLGADLSPQMLVRGLRKLERRGMASRSALACGDAERLPLRAALFDGAVVAFGIRNIGDRERALREMLRVLRPGGRLVVLEFGVPRGVLGTPYRFYFGHLLPWIGGIISGDPAAYSYLPASVAAFPPPEAFAALMEKAGFGAVSWTPLTGGIATLHRGDKPR
jgi:demethylmenaquinone methyltransferase / 2-methoxy-6-polyprenyl-1,4-benzoquinol methylase